MAYVELKYYRSYALEVREQGDVGWSVHVYAPAMDQRAEKLAVIDAPVEGLRLAISQAESVVDEDLQTQASRLS
ncbi:MAG: hypothetical protein JWR10_2542 [Rubritepida sp.]|nr:hypothetical protein [Rubritepida sp.]